MSALILFKIITLCVGAAFVYFGMDVRRKVGARDFVSGTRLTLMKILSFSLIAAFFWFALRMGAVGPAEWATLILLISGTVFITLAKCALGTAHTFTGQYLERSELVTGGVYRITRNPLYLGVFLCELGALVLVAHQAPLLHPRSSGLWLTAFLAALAYAVMFNLSMARREARHLERCFGERYRRYRARVPFLVPFIGT